MLGRVLLAFQVCGAAAAIAVAPLRAEDRPADQVFQKWLSWQRTYRDVDLSDTEYLDSETARRLSGSVPASIRPQLGHLGIPPALASDREMAAFRQRLRDTIAGLEFGDGGAGADRLPEWLAQLKKPATGFTSAALNEAEESTSFRKNTAKYRGFLEWLFEAGDFDMREARRFAAANRFFEYCFGDTYPDFRQLVETPAYRPIARMLYANIWYNLSGNGWRYWHAGPLRELRRRYEAGDEIVYIAGGTDIYQLIRNGIYNIRIIDPMFPSQTKYYSEGWQFLIRGAGPDGGEGDRILFAGQPGVIMTRVGYREHGEFATPELSDNRKRTLPLSTTVWELRDAGGARLGNFTLERRYVNQADFAPSTSRAPTRSLLISFNELYYITASGTAGWGIDPAKFPSDMRLHVKQLRRPVDRRTMLHMREMSEADFYYIKLGTSVD